MPKPVVLVVDDEPDIRELLSITLNQMELETKTAADVTSAQKLLRAGRFADRRCRVRSPTSL